MSFKWQDKHMELFLEKYKRHECLWNTKFPTYSKSSARERAYSLMLKQLNIPGLTVADIKAKIKTIRTRYGAELTKIRNSELNLDEGGGEVYVPRLFWFNDADQFLRKVFSPKTTYLMPKDHADIPDEKDKNIIQPFEGNDSDSDSVIASSSHTSRYPKNNLKRSLRSNCPKIKSPSPSPVKILKQKPKEDEIYKQSPDEFDYFCESLAIQLKRMPLDRAIICQEKLQHVMTQERLFQLSDKYLSSLPVSFDGHLQQSLSVDVDTQNQSSEHNNSMISSTDSHSHSIIETYQCRINGENESECIYEMKTEI